MFAEAGSTFGGLVNRLFIVCCIFILCGSTQEVVSKRVDGIVALSSLETDVYLDKFSFTPKVDGNAAKAKGYFQVVDGSTYYDNQRGHNLLACALTEEDHTKYRKAMADGSLCKERLVLCTETSKIRPYRKGDPSTAKQTEEGHDFKFEMEFHVESQAAFIYFYIVDCILEFYPAKPPKLEYTLTFLNGDSHLPADEMYMIEAHTVIIIIFGLFIFLYCIKFAKMAQSMGHVHLIHILLGMALILQLGSVVLEYWHLKVYTMNGRGLRYRYHRFPADFLSSTLQSFSELFIIFVLMCLASGWTLAQSMYSFNGGDAGFNKKKMTGLFFALLIVQCVLQVWGREYQDDFAQFHELEHLPGYIMMLIRVVQGVFFVMKITNLCELRKGNSEELEFLNKLKISGSVFIFSFPLFVAFAFVLPSYLRHPFITATSIGLQSIALMFMMLVLLDDNNIYSSISSVGNGGSRSSSLTDMNSNKNHGRGKSSRIRTTLSKTIAID